MKAPGRSPGHSCGHHDGRSGGEEAEPHRGSRRSQKAASSWCDLTSGIKEVRKIKAPSKGACETQSKGDRCELLLSRGNRFCPVGCAFFTLHEGTRPRAKEVSGAESPACAPGQTTYTGIPRHTVGHFKQTQGTSKSPGCKGSFSGSQVCGDFAHEYGPTYPLSPNKTRAICERHGTGHESLIVGMRLLPKGSLLYFWHERCSPKRKMEVNLRRIKMGQSRGHTQLTFPCFFVF